MKNLTLLAPLILLIAGWTMQVAAKPTFGRITQIDNQSPWFVKVQGSDQTQQNKLEWALSAGGQAKSACSVLYNQPYCHLGPKSKVSASDFVIPYQIIHGKIADAQVDVWVLGADRDGHLLNISHGRLQDRNAKIYLDMLEGNVAGFDTDKAGKDVNIEVIIDKDGTISAKKVS